MNLDFITNNAKIFVWVALAIAVFVIVGMKHFWKEYPDDNKIEQEVEQVIKDKTGVTVDLTPESPQQ